jgi:hypothetical protein
MPDAKPNAALMEQQAAEIERLRAVAEQLRSAMIDQHELAEHWYDGDCGPCTEAFDHLNAALACDQYRAWQKAYRAATDLVIGPVTA